MSSITRKQQKFIDEYFVDLNASAAYTRAGYSGKNIGSNAYRLLKNPNIKAEIERRMKHSRMSADDVIDGLEEMAKGTTPTKIVTGSHERKEYDLLAAYDKMGKIYALFVDKQIVENIGLEIIDDDETD